MEERKGTLGQLMLEGKQTAFMVDDHFKISGIGEALLDFNDPLRELS